MVLSFLCHISFIYPIVKMCCLLLMVDVNVHNVFSEERRSCVLELLSDFDETISNLQLALDQLRVQKDTEQWTLQQTM